MKQDMSSQCKAYAVSVWPEYYRQFNFTFFTFPLSVAVSCSVASYTGPLVLFPACASWKGRSKALSCLLVYWVEIACHGFEGCQKFWN